MSQSYFSILKYSSSFVQYKLYIQYIYFKDVNNWVYVYSLRIVLRGGNSGFPFVFNGIKSMI